MPGLYLIETDAKGERKFYYWRDTSPARELFELSDWASVAETLLSARLIYFSGVTLSLYSNTGIGRFLAALELARKQGVKVAFDGNFRPRGWKGDVVRTRAVFTEALKRVDIALPTFEDEAMLWGDTNPEATVERLQAFGIGEIVVKNGSSTALVADRNGREHVPVPEVVEPIDTTAAGDSFNAAYLAARLNGERPGGRRGRGARSRRPGDPPSRRDHAARRERDALEPLSFRGRPQAGARNPEPRGQIGRAEGHPSTGCDYARLRASATRYCGGAPNEADAKASPPASRPTRRGTAAAATPRHAATRRAAASRGSRRSARAAARTAPTRSCRRSPAARPRRL